MSAPGIGTLELVAALTRPDLLGGPVVRALQTRPSGPVLVAEIDPELADTAMFCDAYDVPLGADAR